MDIVILSAAALAAIAAAVVYAPRYWRGDLARAEKNVFRAWESTPNLRLGMIRGIPVILVTASFLLLAASIEAIASRINQDGGALTYISLGFLAVGGLGLVLFFTIAMANQPRFLVPPGKRNGPSVASRLLKRP